MAGDWIKMRGNLWDDPRVAKLCDLTDQGEASVIGALYWLWAAADQHTEDGIMPGLTLRQIDRKTGVQGFGAALCEIGWLADHPEGVRIVNFTEHNGQSAKRRCTDAQRKANARSVSASDADTTQTDEGQKAPNLGAREREEKEKRNTSFSDNMVGAADAAQQPPTTKPEPERKAQRLPADWQLPKAWGEWALTEFTHWTPDVVRMEADKFADHWRTKSGKDGRKADWQAAWRNWCRSDIAQRAHAPPRTTTAVAIETFRERDERLARAKWAEITGRHNPEQRETIDITPRPAVTLELQK